MRKGEITCDKQFSFSHNVFFPIWYLIFIGNELTLSQTSPGFYVSAVQVFWKHCGKRRNCSLRAISPFPTVFSPLLESLLPFLSNLKLLPATSFSLEESKICCLGKVNRLDACSLYEWPHRNIIFYLNQEGTRGIWLDTRWIPNKLQPG